MYTDTECLEDVWNFIRYLQAHSELRTGRRKVKASSIVECKPLMEMKFKTYLFN